MTTLKERVSNSQELNQTTQRILVVDDENSISELIATSLKFVGFDVRTASSGAQALQIAEEFKPHALILDVMLPDQNGFEVCRQLRSEGHNVGVLFLTAKDSTEDKIAGLTIGGDDYVTKPYSKAELSKLYGVSVKTLTTWIKPFLGEIGVKRGRFYTVKQIEILFKSIGVPYPEEVKKIKPQNTKSKKIVWL